MKIKIKAKHKTKEYLPETPNYLDDVTELIIKGTEYTGEDKDNGINEEDLDITTSILMMREEISRSLKAKRMYMKVYL